MLKVILKTYQHRRDPNDEDIHDGASYRKYNERHFYLKTPAALGLGQLLNDRGFIHLEYAGNGYFSSELDMLITIELLAMDAPIVEDAAGLIDKIVKGQRY